MGISIYAIRRGSFFEQAGLTNGDTIHDIAGMGLEDLDGIAKAIRNADKFTITVVRGQKRITMQYRVR